MKQLFKDPRIQLSSTLLLIFLSALFNSHNFSYVKVLIFSVGSTVLFDLLFLRIRKVELFTPTAALTTGLIISLILSPMLPFYEPILAGVIAMFFKNFIRFSKGHILNPAGAGVLFISILLNHNVSWWAVSFQNSFFPYIFLLLPALVSMLSLKRFKITLPFLLTYSALSFFMNSKLSILTYAFDPTIIFFSTVMLPEPMTTPNRKEKQIFFGIFVAISSFLLSTTFLHNLKIADPLIFSLLIGNIIFYKLK